MVAGPRYHVATDYLVLVDHWCIHSSAVRRIPDGIYSTLWGDAAVGWCVKLDPRMEPATDGGRLFVGADFHGAASHRRGQRDECNHSQAFERTVPVLAFCAVIVPRSDFHDAKSPSMRKLRRSTDCQPSQPLCFFGAIGWKRSPMGGRACSLLLVHLSWLGRSIVSLRIDCPSVAQHLYAAKLWPLRARSTRLRSNSQGRGPRPIGCDRRGSHALCLTELGRDDEAINQAERAIELKPDDSDAHLALAISAYRSYPDRANTELAAH